MLPDFQSLPLWLNVGIFALAAAFVWAAGSRLAKYADLIAERTDLGRAFVGVIFLAAATSLPEIATTVTASATGSIPLAVNNLFGGIALQTAILAVADRASGARALTRLVVNPVLLLQGLLLVMLLALVLVGSTVGDVGVLFGIGLWPALVFGAYLLGVYLLRQYRGEDRWRPVDLPEEMAGDEGKEEMLRDSEDWSTRRVGVAFLVGSLVILVAGTTIARVGGALATQTGLGGSFIGATLVALATSLPEVSTTVSAARLGAYSLAVSNVFGSNLLLPALLFPAELVSRSGSTMAAIDPSSTFAAAAGIVLTATYLVGLIERRDRTVVGLGLDSAAVVVLYLATLVGLYALR